MPLMPQAGDGLARVRDKFAQAAGVLRREVLMHNTGRPSESLPGKSHCKSTTSRCARNRTRAAVTDTESRRVERFATKKVAHLDEAPPAALPTFDELDACVDLLERIVLNYELILKISAPHSLLPTWQYDWKAIFYEPWIPRS